jgi:N6-adenosine-specific RNA methylase IME4
MSAMRYATIVADPPWTYAEGWPVGRPALGVVNDGRRTPLKYDAMSVKEIATLPVRDLADPSGCHLYLWTTNRYLPDAFGVVKAWGFRYSQLLVWAKTPMGCGPGGTFAQNAEYILFARRGSLRHKRRLDSVWFNWPRTAKHSKKPEHFLDMVETVSPGPYLELFSRRHRLGWSVWGDQVQSSIEVSV